MCTYLSICSFALCPIKLLQHDKPWDGFEPPLRTRASRTPLVRTILVLAIVNSVDSKRNYIELPRYYCKSPSGIEPETHLNRGPLFLLSYKGHNIIWYSRRDLNPHALRQRILSPLCLPFHHSNIIGAPRGI